MSRIRKRQLPKSVFSLPMILLLIGAVAVILALLYQQAHKHFFAGQSPELVKAQFADRWLAQFQQMLHGTEPVDATEVLNLAQQLAENGYWQESDQLLNEKLPYPLDDAALVEKAADLQLKNSLTAYYTAVLAKDNTVGERMLTVRARLQALGDTQQLDNATLVDLAKQCADFGLLPQAATLYAYVASRDQAKPSQWWAEAAKWIAQAGDQVKAASYLRQALDHATDPNEIRLYTYAWWKQAIQAGQEAEVAQAMQDTAPQLSNNPEDLQQLAKISEELARPELTSELYATLAEQDAYQCQKWLEKSAYWAEQAHLYTQAAQRMQQALDITARPSEAHALNVRLMDVWMKAKRPDQAQQVAQRLLDPNGASGDWDLLEKGVNIALAAKDLDQARTWNRQYLQHHEDDAQAYLRQTDIEILAKDFPAAAQYIEQAARLEPNNILFHERWAYIAERMGDKALAMNLWDWLYQQTGDKKFRRSLVQVAYGSENSQGTLEHLLQLAQREVLPVASVKSVFSALAGQNAERAEQFMQGYLQQHHIADLDLWQYLSDWQVGQQRFTQALATWQQADANLGQTPQSRFAQMQIYWQMQQPEQAGTFLAGLDESQVALATPYQLEILSELSWQQHDYAHALQWYSQLLAQAKPETAMESRVLWYTRIAEAYKQTGQVAQALATLQAAWQTTQQPDLLLNALQMAIETQQWDTANQLVSLGEAQGQTFELQGRYWLLRAELANQQQQPDVARELYQHLLLVEQNMTPLRKQALLQYLALLQNDADGTEFERIFAELDGAALAANEKASLYETAMSRALANKDNAQLQALSERAQAQGVTLAPWIQLASVMQRKDKAAVAKVLASGAELNFGDRFAALVMLGREDEAYQVARHAMKSAPTAEERQRAKTLALSLAPARVASVNTSVQTHQMDGLNTQEQHFGYRKGQENGMPGYSLDVNRTRLSGSVVPDGVQHETDITAGLHWQQTDRQLDATVGVNQREDSTRPHANVRYSQQFNDSVAGNASYGFQENPSENAWLRANAMRNQAQVGVDVNLGNDNHAQLATWQSDFADRASGQQLAGSKGGRATVVHRGTLGEQQQWYAGVEGSAEYFDKANGLDATQQQGIPDDTRNVALLAGISNGSPGNGVPPQDDQWRYNVSGSIGKQLTTGNTTQRIEASVGKRVSQDDELSAGAFYGTGENTGKDYGLFMQYRKWLDFTDEDIK